ncbi:MAG: RNA methyltransferase [Castellaniella sp.]|uniref:TrmH family RNA methyltransferase n=1 Tax=Castellaniella sp. TaxID=1955812 RepID=UPI002A35EB6B|nr:RNA methyltransferase [Castellaniella sp.]MDY0308201.1 RNA methyltransferase [Castellaniella sp.]
MKHAAPVRHIASRDNPDYRAWLRLAQGRPGRLDPRVILEGEHLCRAWLEHKGPPPLLVVGESALSLGWVGPLWQACAHGRRVVLQDNLAAVLSQVEHGPAVFFVVEPPVPELPARIRNGCLWLDRVQDPGNLGTLLRTAAAAGLRQAYLSNGCAAAWSPKVLRSGQGAHFALEIHEHVDLQALSGRLDIPLAATTLDQAEILYAKDLRQPCAWLFGNEGQGVADELLMRADWRIHIPQAAAVESLNVAAAAAVCLFEQRRQQLMVAVQARRTRR